MKAAKHNTLISSQYASILFAAVFALAVVAAQDQGQAAAAPAEELLRRSPQADRGRPA
jgi:hypothetical protein